MWLNFNLKKMISVKNQKIKKKKSDFRTFLNTSVLRQ